MREHTGLLKVLLLAWVCTAVCGQSHSSFRGSHLQRKQSVAGYEPGTSAERSGKHGRQTCEDMKAALYTLGRLFQEVGNKLDRHEFRERQLGETLQQSLQAIEKKQRSTDTVFSAAVVTLARLDERLRNVESSLRESDDVGRLQLRKVSDGLSTMLAYMEGWQKKAEAMVAGHKAMSELQPSLEAHLGHISASLDRLSTDNNLVAETSDLRMTSLNLLNVGSETHKALSDVKGLLNRYDTRLSELASSRMTEAADDWHSIFLTALERHEDLLKDMKRTTEASATSVLQIPGRHEILSLANSTVHKMEDIYEDLVSRLDKTASRMDHSVAETLSVITRGQDVLMKTMSENTVMTEGMYGQVQANYEDIVKGMKDLSNVEQVIIQTADNVMDTKRRLEYGVHQILSEVAETVKAQSERFNDTVSTTIDMFSTQILENQRNAMTKIVTTIESEMGQVWRQIGIMYKQLTMSTSTLEHLQRQTEAYVNGTVRSLDGMEDKVVNITSRMNEFDGNLNHLLGRLSLFTQEFNRIKAGLGEALDNIWAKFRAAQEKVNDIGSGPNPIPETSSQHVTFPYELEPAPQ